MIRSSGSGFFRNLGDAINEVFLRAEYWNLHHVVALSNGMEIIVNGFE